MDLILRDYSVELDTPINEDAPKDRNEFCEFIFRRDNMAADHFCSVPTLRPSIGIKQGATSYVKGKDSTSWRTETQLEYNPEMRLCYPGHGILIIRTIPIDHWIKTWSKTKFFQTLLSVQAPNRNHVPEIPHVEFCRSRKRWARVRPGSGRRSGLRNYLHR